MPRQRETNSLCKQIMANVQTITVMYTGKETPFVDRIYRSRLTFEPGQVRELPADLATKFLRHADVFARSDAVAPQAQEHEDDTAQVLDASRRDEDERRALENERFELHQQLEKMDKKALREWAKLKFRQEFPGALSEANLRERVKALVDQYGAP